MYHILHLDDNPTFTQLVGYLLRGEEINYNPVTDTGTAWMILQSRKPDLLIADLMLDYTNNATQGVEFIKKVHIAFPGLKILVLSARCDDFLREELAGMINYFETKTFKPSSFNRRIINLIINGVY